MAWAVSAMTGIFAVAGSDLILRAASQPSITGRLLSSLHSIRFEAIGYFGKEEVDLSLSARTAHPRRHISDKSSRVDKPLFKQRQVPKLHRRRIAAGAGDQLRSANTIAIGFRQTINRL